MTSDRFHLTLTVDGRPVANGWWADRATADRKFTSWVGDWGRPGALITLVDEETGATLTEWPAAPAEAGTLPA